MPSERTRPFPGAWPSRPCSLRRTPSRVRKPGPSPLRSLYSVRSNRTSQPVRGSACSVRRQPVLFIAACSSGAHCHLSLLSPALLPSMPSACPPAPAPSRFTENAYPRDMITTAAIEAADDYLARADPPPALRRLLTEGRD